MTIMKECYKLNIVFITDNVDTQIGIFNKGFNKSLDSCAPVATREIRRPFA